MKVISADNVKGNFFGGLPYNATWDFGGGNSPSKLTVSVVNERGVYGDPSSSLGYTRTQSVKLGGFSFNGYLVSYSLKETPEAKTLELSYVDKSIDLDRYYVGLKELWGNKGGKNLILVGKRYHPCDTDMDSTVEYQEIEGIPDPCDPCPEMPPKKYENACDELLTEFEIFPVYYTFNELVNKLPVNCNFNGGSDYIDFRGDFIGPLKSVLDSWCSTLGLAYFWDPFNNILEIVSRSKKIAVPSISRGNNIIDLEIGATVENTFARGTVGYLGRKGEIKEYSCAKSTLENLSCLTLGDLAADGEFNSGGGGSDGSGGAKGTLKDYEAKEIAVSLAYYSQSMRNAFIWFYHYGIYGPSEAKSRKSGDGGTGPSKDKMPTDKLSFMGNMEILEVFSAEGDEKEKSAFNRINRKLSREQREHLNLGIDGKESRGTALNPNYYFIVARINEELFEKELSNEENLARGFLGKYWYSDFKTTIPNTTNYKTEVNIEAPDGNGQWYFKNTQLKNLPIFNYGHEEGSFIGSLDDELSGSEDEIQAQINKYINRPDEKEVQVNGFILHEREGVWEPNQDFAKWYQKLFDWYSEQIPQKFAQSDGRPDILFGLGEIGKQAKSDGAIKLFVARKGSQSAFETKIEVIAGKHPAEAEKRPIKTTTDQSVFGDVEIKEIAEYGLGSASKYVKLTIGKSNSIIIHCPVGCFAKTTAGTRKQDSSQSEGGNVLYGENFIKGSQDGYDVIANAQASFSIYLPKLEETYVSPPNTVNVSSVTYEYFDQMDNNLEPFRKGSSTFRRTNCMPDKSAMIKYMQKLDKFVKYSQDQPTKRVSFRMAGIFPNNYGIYDGLSSVSINITDNGVFTNYVLEDKIITPPSAEVLSQRLRQNLPPRKSLNDGKEPINITNVKSYENAVRPVGS